MGSRTTYRRAGIGGPTVFTTPWSRASVTISPFGGWLISCPERMPDRRSMTKTITPKGPGTARFVGMNGKVRFISLFFAKNSLNMSILEVNSRDVAVQIQAAW